MATTNPMLWGDPIGLIFDYFDVFLMVLFGVVVFVVWSRLRRHDNWAVVAHRTVRFVLVASVLVVAVRCVDAANGGGVRIGSDTIGVRAGDHAVAVQLQSSVVDPDHAPSSRFLNAQGVTSISEGRPAALTRASFEIPVRDPPEGAAVAVVFSGLVSLLPWFIGLLAIERILRRARAGHPFSRANIRDLRWLAFAFTVAVYLALAVDYLVTKWVAPDVAVGLMLQPGYEERIEPRLTFPFAPLAYGALILALAEVWRSAIQLQEDAEATV